MNAEPRLTVPEQDLGPAASAPGSWAHAFSRHLEQLGHPMLPGLCALLGAGLWLSLDAVESLRGERGPRRLRLFHPNATETLASALQFELTVHRRGTIHQAFWIARRAIAGNPTVVRVSATAVEGGAPGQQVYAYVHGASGGGDPATWHPKALPEDLRVELELAPGVRRSFVLAELARVWFVPEDLELSTESASLVPSRGRSDTGPDWAAALARQQGVLRGPASGRWGLPVLGRLAHEVRGAADGRDLLRAALGPAGLGSGRWLHAEGLEALAVRLGRPVLARAARAARASSEAWVELAARAHDEATSPMALSALVDGLVALETSLAEALGDASEELS